MEAIVLGFIGGCFAVLFTQFSSSIFSFYNQDGLGWFMLFGYGLHWKDVTRHRLSFSERNGIKKIIRVGKYSIRTLLKNNDY